MRTLVIYDNEGFILTQMSGDVREPIGLPFLWVDIPDGKILVKIDVSETEPKPVFKDMPKSDLDLLKEQVEMQEQAIIELSMMLGGI